MPKPLPESWRHTCLTLYGYAAEALRLADGQRIAKHLVQVELDKIAAILAKELGCEPKDLVERKGK